MPVSVTEEGPAADAGTSQPTAENDVPRVVRAPRPAAPQRPRRWLRWLAWVVAVPVALVLALVVAWGVDSWLHSDQVARNTELAGRPVGGMTRPQLERAVARLERELPGTTVRIDTGEFTLDSTAADLGVGIDDDRTVDMVWAVGRSGSVVARPFEWLGSLFAPRDAEANLDVDRAKLAAALAALEGDRRSAPVEPTLTAQPDGVQLVPGKDGTELTTDSVEQALPRTLNDVGRPIQVQVERSTVPPRVSDASVQALADQANQVTGGKVELTAGSQSFEIDGKDFRPAFAVAVEDQGGTPTPRLTMQPDAVAELLRSKAPAGAGNPTGVRFTIEGGVPTPVPGTDAQVCCGDGAPDAIVAALLAGKTQVDLPTRTVTAAEGVQWAQGLGVKEVVGQFTTNHPAGQPRVTNIHTISDATRGVLIAPGDTFSVNGFVGRRTAAKGYVEAPVIENGEHSTDIGGGVSQYATTLFNAAFFAGLDIPAYKAHSEYISRYPYGREATVAYPSVDLKIHNDTPYGVVIWPTYTGSSITIQLWSTKFATGAQTAQSQSSGCGKVTTQRTTTFVDGRTEVDKFYANYDCK